MYSTGWLSKVETFKGQLFLKARVTVPAKLIVHENKLSFLRSIFYLLLLTQNYLFLFNVYLLYPILITLSPMETVFSNRLSLIFMKLSLIQPDV